MKALSIAGLAASPPWAPRPRLAPPQTCASRSTPSSSPRRVATTPTTHAARRRSSSRARSSTPPGRSRWARSCSARRASSFAPTGGPGQPQSLFIRGAGSAQTLVLVDGMRVGSATVGTTSIEHIPLEMIERIEVVKGPLSSLYGVRRDRRRDPGLHARQDRAALLRQRGATAPTTTGACRAGVDRRRRQLEVLALAAGYRAVDAPSATNSRNLSCYNPDRDPYDNAFFNLHLVAEACGPARSLELDAFTSHAHTHFDAGPGDDRNYHVDLGAKFSSSTIFRPWWTSRLTVGEGRDRLEDHGLASPITSRRARSRRRG